MRIRFSESISETYMVRRKVGKKSPISLVSRTRTRGKFLGSYKTYSSEAGYARR